MASENMKLKCCTLQKLKCVAHTMRWSALLQKDKIGVCTILDNSYIY